MPAPPPPAPVEHNGVIFLDSSDEETGTATELLYNDEYSTAVRMRIQRMLLMQFSPTNPRTFNQETLRSQLVGPLQERKGYIIKRALSVEKSDSRWGSTLSKILMKAIPDKSRGKGGLKANASKVVLVGIVTESWTAIRKIHEHEEGSFSREANHDLEMYLFTMRSLESDCIAAVLHESNVNVNSESLPCPRAEKDRDFDPKLVPEARFRICARCKLKSVNYPANYKEIQKERAQMTSDFLKLSKQFDESKKDPSVLAPVNKNGKVYTKPPSPPTLPSLYLICKGYKMKHEHGLGRYKCPDCTDRSCKLCQSKCMFVCTTE
jgi:hypothetical protein